MSLKNYNALGHPSRSRAEKEVAVATSLAKLDVIKAVVIGGSINDMESMRGWESRYDYKALQGRHNHATFHFSARSLLSEHYGRGNFIIAHNADEYGYEVNGLEGEPDFIVTPIMPEDSLANALGRNPWNGRRSDEMLHRFTAEELPTNEEASPHVPYFIDGIDIVYDYLLKQLKD